jgi:hypothetical protein
MTFRRLARHVNVRGEIGEVAAGRCETVLEASRAFAIARALWGASYPSEQCPRRCF